MSAMTSPRPVEQIDERIRFSGLLQSERIKLTSVRGPAWAAAAILALGALLGFAILLVSLVAPGVGDDPREVLVDAFGDRPGLQALAYVFMLSQGLIALFGVLIVSSERGSGLIAVTLAA